MKNNEQLKDKKRKYDKEYRLKNKEMLKERDRIKYLKNKEKYIERAKKWNKNNRKRANEINKKYYLNNIEKLNKKINKYQRERRKYDFNYKMKSCLRTRIWIALKGKVKSKKTINLLQCTVEELWLHLEKQFKPGMTRENHGLWHIDHIIPCSSFDLTKPEEQAQCFHYTNLQPLWASENLAKGSKIS